MKKKDKEKLLEELYQMVFARQMEFYYKYILPPIIITDPLEKLRYDLDRIFDQGLDELS